jgi:hypothetical protein
MEVFRTFYTPLTFESDEEASLSKRVIEED